tara:strand:+ start:77392 stop:78195 length:804 start_codon:yes stop_codon:yes gene_type:complete
MSGDEDLAQRLLQAARERVPLSRDQGDRLSLASGYALQRLGLQAREACLENLSGWKVAFANAAAQRRFGLSEPVYGVLTDAMELTEGRMVDLSLLIQPKLEVEMAMILGNDLGPGFHSDEELISAIAEVAPAFEIADCRWQGWHFDAGAFLADNAAAALYRIGPGQAFDAERHGVVSYRLAHDGETLAQGDSGGRADTPLVNLCWLLRRLLADGQPLRAGQAVLSGSLLAPLDIEPGEYRLQMLDMELALAFEQRHDSRVTGTSPRP